jgi:pimeloyl-ACP methyl ester carboxylesterase
MPTITTSDGVRLHYLDDGDPAGPPVVLLAGFRAPTALALLHDKHATAMAEAGPKVEAAVVGSGHAVNIERPDEFNQLLLRFIG